MNHSGAFLSCLVYGVQFKAGPFLTLLICKKRLFRGGLNRGRLNCRSFLSRLIFLNFLNLLRNFRLLRRGILFDLFEPFLLLFFAFLLQFLLTLFVFIVYFSQLSILSCFRTEFDKSL